MRWSLGGGVASAAFSSLAFLLSALALYDSRRSRSEGAGRHAEILRAAYANTVPTVR